MPDTSPARQALMFTAGDTVTVLGDQPTEQTWTITEIVTGDPQHDGPFAILTNAAGDHSWSALRILRPAQAETIAATAARRLDQLGLTADDVADRLRALAIKGVRNSETSCPIAHLLTSIPGILHAEVLEAVIGLYRVEDEGLDVVEVEVPAPVSAFIVHFDRGVYLDLVSDNSTAVAR